VGEVVEQLRQVGAAAVTIHGRTAIEGYSKPSDWNLSSNVVQENHRYYSEDGLSQQQQQQQQKRQLSRMAIVGNGDIFTHYEAKRRFDESQVDAVMVGRGALIKPWIFQEYATQQSWEPTLEDRVSIYRRLTCYFKITLETMSWDAKRLGIFYRGILISLRDIWPYRKTNMESIPQDL